MLQKPKTFLITALAAILLLTGCTHAQSIDLDESPTITKMGSAVAEEQNLQFNSLKASKELKETYPKLQEIVSYAIVEGDYVDLQVILNNINNVTEEELALIVDTTLSNVTRPIEGFKFTILSKTGEPIDIVDSIVKTYGKESYEIVGAEITLHKKLKEKTNEV